MFSRLISPTNTLPSVVPTSKCVPSSTEEELYSRQSGADTTAILSSEFKSVNLTDLIPKLHNFLLLHNSSAHSNMANLILYDSRDSGGSCPSAPSSNFCTSSSVSGNDEGADGSRASDQKMSDVKGSAPRSCDMIFRVVAVFRGSSSGAIETRTREQRLGSAASTLFIPIRQRNSFAHERSCGTK